jgi:Ca-activated chloride channel family protein
MLAADIRPSRLEKAKEFINKLVDEMPDNRIGLVLFAGYAYLQMPLTVDHGAAKMYVSTAGPDAVPQQGTVIGEALKRSANTFNDKEERFKGIVLITDGEDHDPDAIKNAKELADRGVMINTIGIGSQEGSPIIDAATGTEKKDAAGNIVISKLNEDELKQVAEKTNGIYIHLQNSDEAVSMLSGYLARIEKKAFPDKASLDYKSFYAWLATVMFILLLAENFIPERKKIAA